MTDKRAYIGRLPPGVPMLPAYSQRVQPRIVQPTPVLHPAIKTSLPVPVPPPKPVPAPPRRYSVHLRRNPDPAVRAVLEEWQGVTWEEIIGPSRTQLVVEPRFALYRILREHCGWSTGEIGKLTGRDHTSVVHGLARVSTLLVEDPVFAARLRRTVEKMNVDAIGNP